MRTWTQRRTLVAILSIVAVCFFLLALWAGGRREVTLEGTVESGFETSAFFPNGDCSRKPFWFNWPDMRGYDFIARIKALGYPDALHVKLIGNVSRLGRYGHLGAYHREVWPTKIMSVDSAPPCWPKDRPVRFPSPDGELVALVRSTKAPEATIESRVELRKKDGQVLKIRSYASGDGEHGYGIARAGWTPDSQFFVYMLESSGGHQSWHTPVDFFSRRDNKIVELDQVLNDAVSNSQFLISPPDRVTVELLSSKQTRTVSLGQLRTRGR